MKKQLLVDTACFLLILLFTYAGFSKLFAYALFVHDMQKQPLPGWLAGVLTIAVPLVEIGAAALLVAERTRKAGLFLSVVIMLAFTVYTALILSFFFGKIPCSCGGVIRSLTWGQHLWFNLFFLAVAGTGLVLKRKNNTTLLLQ